jgi:hypothetical protein
MLGHIIHIAGGPSPPRPPCSKRSVKNCHYLSVWLSWWCESLLYLLALY